MKKYICREAGCNQLLDQSGYCDKHKKERRKPFENAQRSNEGLYNTSKWQKLRMKHLEEQDCCVYCGNGNRLTADHIIPPRGNEDLFFSEDNLQTLCFYCHQIKTNEEIQGRNKKHT
jgi:5-methylcytosine-specific restriction protein A